MTQRVFLTLFTAAACVAALIAAAPPAGAQAAPPAPKLDARFNSWLGCWRLEDDLAGTGARLCITPDGGGVRLQTIVGSQRGIDELVIADGVTRAIADSECKGTEHAEWSNDGTRVFRATDVTCNKETPRKITSVAFMAPGPTFVNVQHVTGDSAANVRAQRYRRAANQNLADGTIAPQPMAALAGDLTWSVEDVIEASGKLPAEALQAALADVRQKFPINRRTLLSLDDAGVPDSVIDLMVALTFPSRFVVERASASAPVGVSTGMGWYDPLMSPLLSPLGSYSNCYTNIGHYGYRSYYNMCGPYGYGYNYYGYNYGYNYGYYGNYFGNGGWIPVGSGGSGGGEIEPSGNGRVINGRGYTQIRERSAEPVQSRIRNGGDGSAAGWSGNSGGGGVSSGGYSSGSSSGGSTGGSSSSGDSGRTAVARPPGGGY